MAKNSFERPPVESEKPKIVTCPHCGGKKKGKNGKDCSPCDGKGTVADT